MATTWYKDPTSGQVFEVENGSIWEKYARERKCVETDERPSGSDLTTKIPPMIPADPPANPGSLAAEHATADDAEHVRILVTGAPSGAALAGVHDAEAERLPTPSRQAKPRHERGKVIEGKGADAKLVDDPATLPPATLPPAKKAASHTVHGTHTPTKGHA